MSLAGRSLVRAGVLAVAATCLIGVLYAQLPFKEYLAAEYDYGEIPKPPGGEQPAEWTFARLMYPPAGRAFVFNQRGFNDWRVGGTSWTIDYPRADRNMAAMARRLTRIHARGLEQAINIDEETEIFNYPWLYVVEPGTWGLTQEQAIRLRQYLLRGGFLMTDDFHTLPEWNIFLDGISQVFPDRQIVEIPSNHPIFHTLWDLDERFQVPGEQFLYSGRTWEKDASGMEPHWRGIFDDDGRVMVAICYNMDLGDAVEHSDNPRFPEKYSAAAMQTFVDYLIYAMSH